jgi:hypothetical protein
MQMFRSTLVEIHALTARLSVVFLHRLIETKLCDTHNCMLRIVVYIDLAYIDLNMHGSCFTYVLIP